MVHKRFRLHAYKSQFEDEIEQVERPKRVEFDTMKRGRRSTIAQSCFPSNNGGRLLTLKLTR